MPLWDAFCGPAYTARSAAIDAELCVNLMFETTGSAGNAKKGMQIGTPGVRVLTAAAAQVGGRGVFTQDGRTWTVIGARLYEATVNAAGAWTLTDRGLIVDDGSPVSWTCNGDGGNQLVIVGGGELKVLNLLTNVLSAAISLPLTNAPAMVGFLDGYILLLEDDALRIWFSALEDATTWDALDFLARSTAADHFVAMVVANERVWGFGSETSQAYEDTGDPDTPFQPIHGSLFHLGAAARWAVSVGTDTIRWLGASKTGGTAVYRIAGYGGERLSTAAIDSALETYATLADAEAETIHQDGHRCYALTCPSAGVAGVTWVWDETEGQWHQRDAWDAALGQSQAWRVRGHAQVGTLHLVGTRDTGDLCALDPTCYDDGGRILRAVRRAPYLGAENQDVFLDAFEVGTELGVGTGSGQGADPHMRLNISVNSAKTWETVGLASLGPIGGYDDEGAVWRRLGRARLDRLVLEVVITDPVKRVIGPGAWIRATPGTGQR